MKTITDTVKAYRMLPRGCSVLCAVSGGADSVCLLHWLLQHWEELGIRVCAAHYEHGIRGEESLRDMEFVKQLCAEWEVPLTVGRGDVPAYAAEHSLGMEEAARELRYAFLRHAAEENGCDRIATAHNADDNTETVLFNLTRGTGPAGLCGIPPVRDGIVRPLLGTGRQEIERYLAENGIAHIEDSSNASDVYSRNRIRHEVIPVLKQINSGLNAAVVRTGELLRSDEAYLDTEAEAFLTEYAVDGCVPTKKLAALPDPVKTRVIRKLCPKPLSFIHVEDIKKLAEGTELAYLDVPGTRIRRQKGKMYFHEPPAPKKIQKKEIY